MIFEVKVQSKSSQRKLEKLDSKNYKAYLHSPPQNNQANEELLELLAKELNVKKYNIKVIKGLTSRNKIIRIDQ